MFEDIAVPDTVPTYSYTPSATYNCKWALYIIVIARAGIEIFGMRNLNVFGSGACACVHRVKKLSAFSIATVL